MAAPGFDAMNGDAAVTSAAPSLKDCIKIALLAALAPPAWLLPEPAWWIIARALARPRMWLRGGAAAADDAAVDRALAAAGSDLRSRDVRLAYGAAEIERYFQALREHAPWGWRPAIRVEGLDHVGAARAPGRGVLLYVHPTAHHTLIVKKALAANGIRCVHLSRPMHGLSRTPFGARRLNPVVTRAEDRYIGRRLVLDEAAPSRGLRPLIKALATNEAVSITANASGRSHDLALFGGRLRLARGAASLSLTSGAPLLPVFAARLADGAYQVDIQAPLVASTRDDAEAALLEAYVERVAGFVARHPEQWMEWHDRTRWNASQR